MAAGVAAPQAGQCHRAADLAHDTFVRILGRRQRDAIQEPRAYLATIANGLVVSHWRRRTLEQAWLDALKAQPEPLARRPRNGRSYSKRWKRSPA